MTYDDYPAVPAWRDHAMQVGYQTNPDVVASADISNRCEHWFGMQRCALDAGHDGSCRGLGGLV